jgi:hypothetical protein
MIIHPLVLQPVELEILLPSAINTGSTPVTATITVNTICQWLVREAPQTFPSRSMPTPTVADRLTRCFVMVRIPLLMNFSGTVTGTTFNWTNILRHQLDWQPVEQETLFAFAAVNTGTAPVVATLLLHQQLMVVLEHHKTFTITVNPNIIGSCSR